VLTGKILDRFPGTIFLLGDASNNTGRPVAIYPCAGQAAQRLGQRHLPL
jgi:hypothetical protein